ncbi:MAG: hypothetical protein RL885_17245 [Planctomycetota bacterium]
MSNESRPTVTPAHGVEELITRIRDEGVQAARTEADRILKDANERAARLLREAKAEIAAERERARRELDTDRAAAIESLNMAARDTALELRTRLVAAFERSVRSLVTLELKDEALVRDLVLNVAGRVREHVADRPVQVELAAALFADGGAETEAGERLRGLVHGLTAKTLREGVELIPSDEIHAGARLRLVGEDLELDLTDEALSTLFLEHLLPRFTEMLRGSE